MKSLKLPVDSLFARRSRCGKRSAALVIALAFVVILSGLVAFFLTQSLLETQVSNASASQTEAALFARGAVDSVIGALKQEITAGSVAYYPPSGSDVRDPNCVFLPNYNQTMVPYRMDPGAPPNVLKRSAYTNAPYSGTYYNIGSWAAPKWASSFSTTNPGTSGRAISIARWNAPCLMTPASTNTFIPPDWIYVNRDRAAGPVTGFTTLLLPNMSGGSLNLNYVVGRFAYVVYDEGGLLDANVAGYPSTAIDGSSVTPSMVRNKISEACADLTQIGLANSDINTLVQWRNPTNDASATAYTNYIYSPNTNAFLTPAAGERVFTSRQQLIDFLTQYVANGNATTLARVQGALPYLTHFSRELNAPSWYPPPTTVPSSGTYGYYNNATNNSATNSVGNLTNINVFVPLARATASVYSDSTNFLTLQSTNQPVAFARFPLSRLAWLGTNGPANGATAAQIQQSFGLVWDSSNNSTNCAWIYAGPTGSAVTNSIYSLGQITGREPNFFELLKAGILAGSVNVTPNAQSGSIPPPGAIDPRYSQSDQQIIQIGLSAIDQASSALLPTRMEFGANTNGDWNSSLYGNKNLPYLYKMIFSPYRPTAAPAVTAVADGKQYTDQYFSAWEEPVFWNPYQTVTTNTAPLQIRIRADGTNNGVAGNIGADTDAQAVLSGGNNLYVQCAPEVQCGPAGPATQNGGANGSSIELDSPNAATFCSLAATPIMLSSLLTNGFTPVFNDLRAQNPIVWPSQANMDIYTESGCTYAGFWLGMVPAPDQPDPDYAVKYQTTTYEPYAQSEFYSGPASHRSTQQFVLEANYGTTGLPNWQEVQRMRFDGTTSHSNDVEEDDNFTVVNRRLAFQTFNDPRTGRFSFDLMNPSSYYTLGNGNGTALYAVSQTDINAITWTTFPSSANYFTGRINYVPVTSTSTTMTPSWAVGSNPATFIDSFRLADNSGGGLATTPNYADTDGVQRPADGWWSSATANTLPMRLDTPQDAPVILNRPFHSVGELGYVFRDMPWRSLNFCSTNSPDAGLLDFFCVNDGYAGSTNAPVVAGVLDLNTQNPQVLQAMLNGAARAQLYPANDVTATDATNMANTITNYTSINSTISSGPLLNKSEIATRVAPADPTVLTTATAEPGIDTNIKERREVIVRALASAGQVRTWNLMIDVIAQTGHLPPNATGFNNFVVTAEQRYWAHVAIDRYTGQVVSLQLEPVSE